MRSLTALTLTLALSVALATISTDSTDSNSLDLASLKFADGGEAVEAHPVGDDTVLEKGAEREVDFTDLSKPETVPENEPVTHTLDTINLPDSQLEATTPSTKLSEKVAALDAAVARGYKHVYCPSKCSLYRKYCPYGCKRRVCYIRYRIKIRIKRRYRIKYPVKVYRRYRVRVKYCKTYGYKTRKCYYRWVTKYIVKTVYRYKYVIKFVIVYRYKYRKGLRCTKY